MDVAPSSPLETQRGLHSHLRSARPQRPCFYIGPHGACGRGATLLGDSLATESITGWPKTQGRRRSCGGLICRSSNVHGRQCASSIEPPPPLLSHIAPILGTSVSAALVLSGASPRSSSAPCGRTPYRLGARVHRSLCLGSVPARTDPQAYSTRRRSRLCGAGLVASLSAVARA